MNALYGAHPGTRANYATGAVFEGTFMPAPGTDGLSSAVFLKGPPTPLTIRFHEADAVLTASKWADGPPALRSRRAARAAS
jgi:catalase